MILHIEGVISIDGWQYPQRETRFSITAGKVHQMGAGPARLAATAPLVEAIAELVTDWNAGRGRFAPEPESEHIQDMEGEHFAVTR